MALGYSQSTGGATLTSEEVHRHVIDPLRSASVVLRAIRNGHLGLRSPDELAPAHEGPIRQIAVDAPNIIRTDGVPLRLPRITSVPITSPWKAENELIDAVDPLLDEVVLLPSSLRSLKTLVKLSDELVGHAVTRGGAAQAIGESLVNELALILDAAFLAGTGASNTIRGLSQIPNVQKINSVGALTLDVLHDAMGLAMGANAHPSAWFANPRDLIGLRKLRDENGAYLMQSDARFGSTPMLLGLPVYVSTMLAANTGTGTDESSILLVDTDQIAVGVDHDFKVRILTERFADYGQIGVRVTARWDIGARNEKGIVVLNGVKPVTPYTP